MNVLVLGDSEARTFNNVAKLLEAEYVINVRVNFQPRRNILESFKILQHTDLANTDVLFLMGLVSFAWRKVPLEGAGEVTIDYRRPHS